MHKFLPALLCAVCLAACSNAPAEVTPSPPEQPSDTSPGYFTAQEIIDRMADDGYLGAQAVIASGLYDDLSGDDYPLMLMVFRSDGTLEAYLSEQGLSKEAFLTHPKLRSFMEHHLIDSYVDTVKIRSTKNTKATYISAAGSDVVLTTADNLYPENGEVMFANGVPVEAYCSYSGNGGDGQLQVEAQICFADAPIVDFDWSG